MGQNKKAEIDFFNKLNGEYDTFSKETYSKIFQFIKLNEIKNKLILDAGCGTGIFSRKLGEYNRVIGIDISENMIEFFNKNNNNKKITLMVGDLENINIFEKEKFDIIFSSNLLHHFYDYSKVASNFNFWLKKGGTLIIIEPNGSNPIHRISNIIRSNITSKLIKNNKYATENEIAHSYRNYIITLKKLNFILDYECSINLIGDNKYNSTKYNVFEKLYFIIRNFMFFAANYFPFPYNKNSLIVALKKR